MTSTPGSVTVVTTPAILLRTHAYSESSRVLRVYARETGLTSVMARGARRGRAGGRKRDAGLFSEGVAVVAFNPRRDLHTLREFAPRRARMGLARDLQRLAGASMAAELVLGHAGQDPHPELYDLLSERLDRLEGARGGTVVGEALALCWRIVHLLGFEPELEACTACGEAVGDDEVARFDMDAGGVVAGGCAARAEGRRVGPIAREQLASLLRGEVPAGLRGERAHLALLDDFATHHLLDGRPLASMASLTATLARSAPGRSPSSGRAAPVAAPSPPRPSPPRP